MATLTSVQNPISPPDEHARLTVGVGDRQASVRHLAGQEASIELGTAAIQPAIQPVPFVARFLPSLTDVAFLLPLLFLFIKLRGARALLGDGDTGWHIRTGDWILAHGQVPSVDMFSFSRPGAPWFAWEWLWDVSFAALHSVGGLGAVVFASLLVICLTSVMLFRLVRRRCGNGLVAIAVTLLATGGCAIHWLARPHLFTLLFFTLTLHITERAKEGRPALLGWLVPLTVLWVNLHAGFFVLFLILATYIGNLAIQAAIDADPAERKRFLLQLRPWLLTAGGCFLTTFLNPYGWNLHMHMAAYLTDPYNLKYIGEFQGLDFHSPVIAYFEPMGIAAVFVSLWNISRRRFQEALLTLGWLQLALVAERNLPLFTIAAAPFVGEGVMAILRALRESKLAGWIRVAPAKVMELAQSIEETDRLDRVYLASAVPMALLGLLLLLPKPVDAKFESTYDPQVYPEQALPQLLRPEAHRIFTDDEWGDYLIYKLYPTRQVFVDGRSDFYGDDFGLKYQELLTVSTGFQKVLDDYKIDTIVLSPRFALTTTLKLSPFWTVTYDDHVSVIFHRRTGNQVSAVSSDGGMKRGRATANTTIRDLTITEPNRKTL